MRNTLFLLCYCYQIRSRIFAWLYQAQETASANGTQDLGNASECGEMNSQANAKPLITHTVVLELVHGTIPFHISVQSTCFVKRFGERAHHHTAQLLARFQQLLCTVAHKGQVLHVKPKAKLRRTIVKVGMNCAQDKAAEASRALPLSKFHSRLHHLSDRLQSRMNDKISSQVKRWNMQIKRMVI